MQSLIVVDDFYREPEKVRELALTTKYMDVTALNYPGYQSIKSYSSDEILKTFEKIIGVDLTLKQSELTFGKFRIMLAGKESRLKVHIDGVSDWTGLVYLNPPESCQGGTAFYRHKGTGLEGRISDIEAQGMGFSSWRELEKQLINKDTLLQDQWEATMFVGMKFNRLVLFKGNNLFHSHTCSFGDNKENGRLTQNFFFDQRSS